MEELIIRLGDEQADRRVFNELVREIFRYLTTKKIKDIKLFQQKTGTEYSSFLDSLKFPKTMKDDLLDNDEFFEFVIKQSIKFKR